MADGSVVIKVKGDPSGLKDTLTQAERDMQQAANKLESVGRTLENIGNNMTSVGKKLTLGVTTPLTALGVLAGKSAIEFEDAFTGVRKTVDATEEEFASLEKGVRNMALNMPMAAKDIAALAESAGQLGIQTKNILQFTKVVADLGVTTNIVGQEGASQIARFANITGMAQTDFDRFGSTIVALGNNFATTEQEILAMSMRLAGAGAQVGMSESDILGLAAALSSVGIEAEAGGNAFSKVMVDMQLAVETGSEKLDDFARIAGMTSTEFQTAFKDNAAGALTAFVAGLDDTATHGVSAIAVLDDMGITEVRLRDALLRGAGASDLFTGALEMGSKAWEENTALATEAELRYGTTASKMQMLKNQAAEVGIQFGDIMIPILQKLMDILGKVLTWVGNLDDGTKKWVLGIAAAVAAIGPLLVILGTVVSSIGKLAPLMGTLSSATGGLVGPVGAVVAALVILVPLLHDMGTAGDVLTGVIAALVAGFLAYKAALAIQGVIQGVVVGMSVLNTALITSEGLTKANTVGIWLYEAALKAKAIALGIASAATGAWGVITGIVTGQITLATAAQRLWNAAMMANPIGLVIAGVAALAAGIFFLIRALNQQSEETKALVAATEELVAKQKELTDGAAENSKAYKDSFSEMQKAGQVTRQLADDILNLAANSSRTAGQTELLKAQIAELNETVPGLALAFDDQTGSLNMTTEALNEYLTASQAASDLDAQMAESSRLRLEAIQLEEAWAEAARQREEIEARLASGEVTRRADKKALNNAVNDLVASENEYSAALAANASQQEALTPLMEQNAEAMRAAQEAQDAMAESARQVAEAQKEAEEQAKKWADAQKEAVDIIEEAFKRYADSATDMFSRIKQDGQVSVETLTKNLQENAKAVEEWSKNLDTLAKRGLDEGLLQQLRDAGPEAARTVKGLVDASDEELEGLNTAFEEGTRVAVESMKRELEIPENIKAASQMIDYMAQEVIDNEKLETALSDSVQQGVDAMVKAQVKENNRLFKVGQDLANGVIKGVSDSDKALINSGKDAADAFTNGYMSAMGISSPSKVMMDLADYSADGWIQETGRRERDVQESGRLIAMAFINQVTNELQRDRSIDNATRLRIQSIRDTAMQTVQSSNFPQVGYDMAAGVASGIDNGGGLVASAGRRMINNALAAMRDAADSHSPSRETMEIADDMADGLVVRTSARTRDVEASGADLTEAFLAGASKADAPSVQPPAPAVQRDLSIANLAKLAQLLEGAVQSTVNDMVHGATQQIKATASSTTTVSPELQFILYYYGDGSEGEANDVGEMFADATTRELRGRGLAIL